MPDKSGPDFESILQGEPDIPETWLKWLISSELDARQLGALRFSFKFHGEFATEYLPNLVEILGSDADPSVRRDLMYSLERIDPKCLIVAPALRGRLTDVDPGVRQSAVGHLYRMDPFPRDILDDIRVVWRIDPNEMVRMMSASLLAKLSPEPGMAEELSLIASNSPNDHARYFAIIALGDLGEAAWPFRPVVEAALADRDKDIRDVAGRILDRWDGIEPIIVNPPVVVESCEDPPF